MLARSFYAAAEIGNRSNKQVTGIFHVSKFNSENVRAINWL